MYGGLCLRGPPRAFVHFRFSQIKAELFGIREAFPVMAPRCLGTALKLHSQGSVAELVTKVRATRAYKADNSASGELSFPEGATLFVMGKESSKVSNTLNPLRKNGVIYEKLAHVVDHISALEGCIPRKCWAYSVYPCHTCADRKFSRSIFAKQI